VAWMGPKKHAYALRFCPPLLVAQALGVALDQGTACGSLS
jgi:hypothetical protein